MSLAQDREHGTSAAVLTRVEIHRRDTLITYWTHLFLQMMLGVSLGNQETGQ